MDVPPLPEHREGWGVRKHQTTYLEAGENYALEDEWGTLRRIDGYWSAPLQAPWVAQSPPLSVSPRDSLPTGNVKVVYQAGLDLDDDDNADLVLAIATMVNAARRNIRTGPKQSESYGEYSYTLAQQGLGVLNDEVIRVLRKYKVPRLI